MKKDAKKESRHAGTSARRVKGIGVFPPRVRLKIARFRRLRLNAPMLFFGNTYRALRVFPWLVGLVSATAYVAAMPGIDLSEMAWVWMLPLALWSVIKETPGVLRFQAIQTGPDTLKIRLEAKNAADDAPTWERVCANARAYFASQGLGHLEITRAPEAPMRDPKSGKFRNIWAEKA